MFHLHVCLFVLRVFVALCVLTLVYCPHIKLKLRIRQVIRNMIYLLCDSLDFTFIIITCRKILWKGLKFFQLKNAIATQCHVRTLKPYIV